MGAGGAVPRPKFPAVFRNLPPSLVLQVAIDQDSSLLARTWAAQPVYLCARTHLQLQPAAGEGIETCFFFVW